MLRLLGQTPRPNPAAARTRSTPRFAAAKAQASSGSPGSTPALSLAPTSRDHSPWGDIPQTLAHEAPLGPKQKTPTPFGSGRFREIVVAAARGAERLHESPDERQRLVSDLTPAAVDNQAVAPVRHLEDLGDAR